VSGLTNVAVIGAGSWGTALAMVLADNEHEVRLWARRPDQIEEINKHHTNSKYLPNIVLSERIIGHNQLAKALDGVEVILLVVPTKAIRETVKELKKAGEEFEYLFWVGSMGSFDNRSQKIAISFAKLLNEAGVKFAILGNKEKNSGDTPRRLGNEFLFQELAASNIAEFEKNEVKKIVTIDPHAYNIFKNEYPDFGLEAEVFHHTEVLAELVREGRLTPVHEVQETITYHDSCYLGRYNEVYEPPRDILKAIPGVKVVEMNRSRETGMCCGAGGGLMWMEEDTGTRVNVARTEQALEAAPSVISSGCPYCLTMLSDGTKAKEVEEEVGTYDVAELLERSVIGEKQEFVS
jgi:Fe-S oxidoreductase